MALACALAAISGCGGGNLASNTATTSAPNPPAANSASASAVTVTCSPYTVDTAQSSQCSAQLQGSTGSSISWSATAGTITSSGYFTAPATGGSVLITATDSQDANEVGQATITVLPAATSHHVVMVVEENQSYATVVGNSVDWPNLNNLIATGALATHYYANTHPSIGNYFMLTTGQILTNDDNSTAVWNVDNIARRMLAAHVSFRIYAEGITQGYLGGNTGLYVIRHNPFAMLSDVADNQQVANSVIWPFSQFATDLNNNALPEFSFIIPNVDDDAHDGTPQQADTWLQSNVVAPLSNYAAFQAGGDGLLLFDFDESIDTDAAYGGGHVPPVLWGPIVKAGYRQASSTIYQHPSMLRTIMESLQLTAPPAAAATAPSMTEFFAQP